MNQRRQSPWRITGILTLLAVLAIAGSVFVGPGGAIAQETEELRPVGVISDPDDALMASLADCTDVAALAPGEPIAVDDGIVVRVINGEPSAVRYVVEEELASVGAATAIGETSAFIGQLLADEQNNWVECSRFDVDMRTLESDSSRRDNYLYRNTLQSETYPLATFVLRAVEGLDGPMTEEEVTFTLVGDFTFRGVTQLVAWEATGKLDGDALVASAFTEFLMEDYDITPPIVGSVISIAETIRLETDIDARPAV